jgi:DnaJ-class molecular chaperone
MSTDLYQILGVDAHSDAATIRRAYRNAAKRTHPDAGGVERAHFVDVHDAYEILIDDYQRATYDAERLVRATAPGATRQPQPSAEPIFYAHRPKTERRDNQADPLAKHFAVRRRWGGGRAAIFLLFLMVLRSEGPRIWTTVLDLRRR